MKDLYTVTGSSRDQITILCVRSAIGEVIPPMHIFPDVCFGYNELDGSVVSKYFCSVKVGNSFTVTTVTDCSRRYLRFHKDKTISQSLIQCLDGIQ